MHNKPVLTKSWFHDKDKTWTRAITFLEVIFIISSPTTYISRTRFQFTRLNTQILSVHKSALKMLSVHKSALKMLSVHKSALKC